MLAATITAKDLNESLFEHGPLWVQPKHDGIRGQICGSVVYSGREGKLLPNDYVQSFVQCQLQGAHLDSEIMVRRHSTEGARDSIPDERVGLQPTAYEWLPFADLILGPGQRIPGIESQLMSRLGAPDFCFVVFDDLNQPQMRYENRLNLARTQVSFLHDRGFAKYIRLVENYPAYNLKEYTELEDYFVGLGHEGACARLWNGPYKEGRSTMNEKYLMKHKRFVDAECYVLGVDQLYSEAEGCLKDTMGALVCRSNDFDESFKIGTGYTKALRDWWWARRFDIISQPELITYKFQPHGTRDRPRSPVYLNVRRTK